MQIKSVFQGMSIAGAALLMLTIQAARAQDAGLDRINRIVFKFDQGQSQGKDSNAGSNPIVGNWEQVQQARDGGMIHSFWIYGKDGTYHMTSIQEGGAPAANGFRMQFWGRYDIQPAGNGRYLVKTTTAGKLPMTVCVPGYSCRSTGPIPHPQQAYYQFQGNMFQSTDGVTAQRSNVPQALLQPLPSTWNLQPPPPLNTGSTGGGSSSAGSTYNPPKYHVPGQAGTCDDDQVNRVCTINGGSTYRNHATGCLVCTR